MCPRVCVSGRRTDMSSLGDGGPLSAADESWKIERLITLDTAPAAALANEGYWASMHEWSNIEGHGYDGDLKPLSYLWSNEAFD